MYLCTIKEPPNSQPPSQLAVEDWTRLPLQSSDKLPRAKLCRGTCMLKCIHAEGALQRILKINEKRYTYVYIYIL